MASTITGEQIIQQSIRKGQLGKVLLNAEIGALAAGSVTSVLHLRDANKIATHYQGMNTVAYRPGNATGVADYVRFAAALAPTTGVLSVDTNWADDTLGAENVYLLYHGLHPTDIVDCLNQAMKKCYFPNSEPLSSKPIGTGLADAGFQSSATSTYTLGAMGTFTKPTTANSENVYPGMIASGFLDCAAANDYIYQTHDVVEGEQIHDFTLSRLAAGTAMQHILYDVTGSAVIGTSITHAQQQWMWTKRTETVPEDCTSVQWRGGGAGSSDDVYFNAHCFYRTQNRRLILDTTWDTEFKMPLLYTVDFLRSGPEADTYDAYSTHLTPIPADVYDFEMARPGANPYSIQFHEDGWFDKPIYIQGRRAYSDLTTFTLALSETTACDLDLADAALRVELFRGPAKDFPGSSLKLEMALQDFRDANRQFPLAGPAPSRQMISVRGTRN